LTRITFLLPGEALTMTVTETVREIRRNLAAGRRYSHPTMTWRDRVRHWKVKRYGKDWIVLEGK
jgi:hypothetical protein